MVLTHYTTLKVEKINSKNMTETEHHDLGMLIAAATPFLCIHNVRPEPWCRVIKDPKDKRIGPWKYTAEFTVLDEPTWSQKGEVI